MTGTITPEGVRIEPDSAEEWRLLSALVGAEPHLSAGARRLLVGFSNYRDRQWVELYHLPNIQVSPPSG